MQQYYTISEAAAYLGTSRQAVENRIKRGTLAYSDRPMKVIKRVIPFSELVKAKKERDVASGN